MSTNGLQLNTASPSLTASPSKHLLSQSMYYPTSLVINPSRRNHGAVAVAVVEVIAGVAVVAVAIAAFLTISCLTIVAIRYTCRLYWSNESPPNLNRHHRTQVNC